MDRRTALARVVGGALTAGFTLAGCDLLSPDPPVPHPLAAILDSARELHARYESAIGAVPALAERLTPLRDNHAAHIAELRKLIGPTASASPSAPAGGGVPAEESAALAELAAAEKDGQAYATKACLAAKPEYAGLLGAIAACRATHREVLT